MQKCFLLILITLSSFTYAQLETEIIGVNYSNYTSSTYNDEFYDSKTQKIDAFVNYGHDLGKKSKLFYHVSYQNFNISTKTDFSILPITTYYILPKITNYSVLTFATGMKNNFKNDWQLTNFITYGISNNSLLDSNGYFRTFSFLSKQKKKNAIYGVGLYLDNVEGTNILPIVNLKLYNKKRGIHVFFPRHIRLWQQLSSKSYIELKTVFDSNKLVYEDIENSAAKVESITTNLTYNYILNNKFKLKGGFGLPYRTYTYKVNGNEYETVQKSALNITIGMSYVVFEKDKTNQKTIQPK